MTHLALLWSSLIQYYSDSLGINSDNCLKRRSYHEIIEQLSDNKHKSVLL
ncbi:hypothetical protein PROVRETT_08926 [Providencia rettgeri DSM 1131]|nr:hypothetical protein PROVRETT_08926 [Providencia rettgeri DSM 1131]